MKDERPAYVSPREMTNGALLEHLEDNHEWSYSHEDHGT